MKNLMKLAVSLAILGSMFFAAPGVRAQGPLQTGVGPVIEANLGFEYIGQQVPSAGSVSMNGADAGLTVSVTRRFAVRGDVGYARAGDVFSSGHHSDILSYLVGPVYYPTAGHHLSTYIEALAGGARVTGATPVPSGGQIQGFANEFAWAGGGGVEIHTWPSLAMRIGADYLHTQYFDSTATLQGQGNLRALVSFTYYIGGSRGR
jgi:opacity protein-like surface antigen